MVHGGSRDPEYLESVRRDAQKVTVVDGGSQTVPLKLTTPKGV
jgi:hypothetical protein